MSTIRLPLSRMAPQAAVHSRGALTSTHRLSCALLSRPFRSSRPANERPNKQPRTAAAADDPRMSQIVIHGGTVYLSGQVADIATLETSDITAQTEQTLAKVDKLLAEAGTDKSKVLNAMIWVKDMDAHFAPMNAVWNAWLDPNNKPARACVAAPMARPTILVEVQVFAAL